MSTNPACGIADGSIEIFATGGGTQLIYSVDNNNNEQSASSFTGLSAGVYSIVVSDSIGFSTTQTFTLFGTGGLSVDAANITDATCFGFDDGMVDLQISGGTGSYTFFMSNDSIQTNGVFTTLTAGNYDVIIVDSAFCADTVAFIIDEPLEIDFTSVTIDAECPAADGDITITASGGDGTYMYSIDTGATYQTGTNFPGLTSGIYIGVVIDGAGCTDTASIFVNSAVGFGPDIVTLNFISPLCNGSNNGSITVFATGTNPINYSIDGGVNFQLGQTFTGLGSGIYDILVEDNNGCTVGRSLAMQEPDVLVSGIIGFSETCIFGNGKIEFNTIGGTQQYTYSIDSGNTFVSNPVFAGLNGDTYHYVVMDAAGCTDTGTIVLDAGGGPTILSIDVVQPSCPADSDGSIVINAVSQSGTIQYSIDNGAIVFPTDSFPNLPVGVYDIVLVDNDGCTTASQVVLTGPGSPIAGFTASPLSGFIPLDVDFTDMSIGATGFSWDFGDSNSSTSQNPSHTYMTSGNYTVVQTVTDGICTDTAAILIEVLGEPEVNVPNVFTPNGDGLNDVFAPEVIGIAQLQGTIFNRHGAIVYQWEGPEGWWDGYTSPAGRFVASGTYYYVITAVGVEGTQFEKKGFVTLVRQPEFKR